MVRSEDEIRKYDIFKGSVLGVLLLCTAFAYSGARKQQSYKKLRIGLSLVTPVSEDAVIDTETVRFSGSAPGKMVYLISARKKLGESKVDDTYSWSMDIKASDLMDTEVTLVAKDEKDFRLGEKGPMLFTIDDELRKKIESNKGKETDLPVEVTAPIQGQTVSPGITGIFGTGVPNTKVKIYLNKEQIGIVTVDENGEWELSRNLVTTGEQRLSAVSTKTNKSTVVFNVSADY